MSILHAARLRLLLFLLCFTTVLPKLWALSRNSGLERVLVGTCGEMLPALLAPLKVSICSGYNEFPELLGTSTAPTDFYGLLRTSMYFPDFCGLPWTFKTKSSSSVSDFMEFLDLCHANIISLGRSGEWPQTHTTEGFCVCVLPTDSFNQTVALSSVRYRLSWTAPFNRCETTEVGA